MVLTFISPSLCYATALGDEAKDNDHNREKFTQENNTTHSLKFFFKMVQSPVNEKNIHYQEKKRYKTKKTKQYMTKRRDRFTPICKDMKLAVVAFKFPKFFLCQRTKLSYTFLVILHLR